MIGWGEGLDQAGAWLDAQPEAAELRVTAGPWPATLDYYFVVQAYTPTGLLSGFSNEAVRPAPVPPGTTVIITDRPVVRNQASTRILEG